MKAGRRVNNEIKERISLAVKELSTTTVEKIRSWLYDHYKDTYSWNTVRSHLNKLIDEGEVEELIASDEGRRVSVFKPKTMN